MSKGDRREGKNMLKNIQRGGKNPEDLELNNEKKVEIKKNETNTKENMNKKGKEKIEPGETGVLHITGNLRADPEVIEPKVKKEEPGKNLEIGEIQNLDQYVEVVQALIKQYGSKKAIPEEKWDQLHKKYDQLKKQEPKGRGQEKTKEQETKTMAKGRGEKEPKTGIMANKKNKEKIPEFRTDIGQRFKDEEGERKTREKVEKREQKPEKIARPWEEESEKEEARLYEDLSTKFEIEKTGRDHIEKILQLETDEKRLNFAVKWFEENREKLEKEGISSKIDFSKEKKAQIAIEKGAFKDLEENRKYNKDLDNIENIYAIRKDFKKGTKCPIESQLAILNTLDKRAEKIKKEREEMIKTKKSEIEITGKDKELTDLFNDMKELTAKIGGVKAEDLDKQIENRAKPLLAEEEKYVNDEKLLAKRSEFLEFQMKSKLLLGEEISFDNWQKKAEWEKDGYKTQFNKKIEDIKIEIVKKGYPKLIRELIKDKTNKEFWVLMNAGYDVENTKLKGLLGGEIELKKIDGSIEKMKSKDFLSFIGKKIEDYDENTKDEAKKELGKEWKEKHDKIIRDEMEKEIETFAESPEKAAGGIEDLFDRIKGRLIGEFLKEGTKKEKKTVEEMEKLKEYEKTGEIKDPHRFMSEVIGRNKELEKISGDSEDIEEDSELIANYLKKSQGIEASNEDIKNFIDKQKEEGIDLKEILKSEKGWLDYFIGLVLSILGIILEIKKEEKEKND